MTKRLSIEDWLAAKKRVEVADRDLAHVRQVQADRREVLLKELNALDDEVRPIEVTAHIADLDYKRLSNCLLDPWEVDSRYRWKTGNIYCHGREKSCWSNVARLRVAHLSDVTGWQWVVDFSRHCSGQRMKEWQVVFDKPSDNPSADFDKYQKVVEEMLVDSGYILVPETGLPKEEG